MTKMAVARAMSWLDELTSGAFNVWTAAINSVSGISCIDALLREGLCHYRTPNRTELPKSSHVDTYYVYFSGGCSGVRGRKGQHGGGGGGGGGWLAIKEEIV